MHFMLIFCLIFSKYLPTHYPVKGLHFMKVGKMELLINGQTRDAIGKLYQVVLFKHYVYT